MPRLGEVNNLIKLTDGGPKCALASELVNGHLSLASEVPPS